MAQQTINIGAAPDDNTGDPLRTAFNKTNGNFTELYGGMLPLAGGTMTGALVIPAGSVTATSINFGTANTGVYGGATAYNVAISGTGRLLVSSSAVTANGIPFRSGDGTQALPAYSYSNENSSGLWRKGAGSISLSATNSEIMNWNATNKLVTVFGPVVTTATTVSALPAAATAGAGARSFVTDANAATWGTAVAAGGSNKVPVFSDGSGWKIG